MYVNTHTCTYIPFAPKFAQGWWSCLFHLKTKCAMFGDWPIHSHTPCMRYYYYYTSHAHMCVIMVNNITHIYTCLITRIHRGVITRHTIHTHMCYHTYTQVYHYCKQHNTHTHVCYTRIHKCAITTHNTYTHMLSHFHIGAASPTSTHTFIHTHIHAQRWRNTLFKTPTGTS